MGMAAGREQFLQGAEQNSNDICHEIFAHKIMPTRKHVLVAGPTFTFIFPCI